MGYASSEVPYSRLSRLLHGGGFWAIHLACLAAIWTGVSLTDLILCGVLYFVRMFGVTAGYHRYFSHRAYKLGRGMQLLMAILASTSAQRGVLWWAGNHRHHHKHSDTDKDLHSPRQGGLLWAHVGWILRSSESADYRRVKDLARYPELRFLDQHDLLPATVLGLACLLFFGVSGLIVGFFWSTVLVWHATFTINSLTHVIGRRRYATKDDSRNHWALALLTLGEGWHNNHHHYQSSARQGFYWWEIDVTYYLLKAMAVVGLVKGLRPVPRAVRDGTSAQANARSGSRDREPSKSASAPAGHPRTVV